MYLHGMGGNAAEAERYRPLFAGYSVVGLDYVSRFPWEAEAEFPRLFDEACAGADEVILIANSIGAYFAMLALADKPVKTAYFISPIVDMQRLIEDMMKCENVTPAELREKGEVTAKSGQTLSWRYYTYAKEHPLRWGIRTHILYGSKDNLTTIRTVEAFAARTFATLTVMQGGEHWFHTEAQIAFLDRWIISHRK